MGILVIGMLTMRFILPIIVDKLLDFEANKEERTEFVSQVLS